MSVASRTHSQTQRLLAATSALHNLHKSAEICTNLPEPASHHQKSQIEPTTNIAPDFLPEDIRATYPKTDEEVRQFIASLRTTPKPPAQTCRNLHKPATQSEKSQIKPKSHSDTPPAPHSSFPPLPPRQLLAARLLLQGHTAKAVAAHLHVNPHTIAEWKKRPAFQQEISSLLNHQSRSGR